jgi:hypothetical protein
MRRMTGTNKTDRASNEEEEAMKKFQVVMQVVNYAKDAADAEETAGELIDVSKMCGGMIINCGSAEEIKTGNYPEHGLGEATRKYRTEFRVVLESKDSVEAGQKSRDLLITSRLERGIVVRFSAAEVIGEKPKRKNFFIRRFAKYADSNGRNVFAPTH